MWKRNIFTHNFNIVEISANFLNSDTQSDKNNESPVQGTVILTLLECGALDTCEFNFKILLSFQISCWDWTAWFKNDV